MTVKYVSVEEMVAVEQEADAAGHSYRAMMEAAGRGLAEEIQARFGERSELTITGLVGSGNNGGDALVCLDHLHGWGWTTTALLLKSRPDHDPMLERYRRSGGRVLSCTDPESSLPLLAREVPSCQVLLDGVLGTGLTLPVRGDLAALLSAVKNQLREAADRPVVVAVDCPSGMDCDSGEVDPVCLRADLTVTMAAVKQGLLQFPGYDYVGELALVGIDLPPDLNTLKTINREVVDAAAVISALPERPLNSHKGTYGSALLLAGSGSYPGAALLAAAAAYNMGTGLVQIASLPSVRDALAGSVPEATWVPLPEEEGWIAGPPPDLFVDAVERASAVLIGPGLGRHPATFDFLQSLLDLPSLPPLVVDADGLRMVRRMDDWLGALPAGSVLTPHPGEMAELTGWSVGQIQADRVAAAEQFAGEWNQVVVLKGAHTVVAAPEGQTRIIPVATPALAKAGTGDVLAGMITGLMAQGLPPCEAAWTSAWLHGRAGQAAAEVLGGTDAVLAGDVVHALVDVLAWVRG